MKNTVYIGCVESSYIILKDLLQKGYIVSGIVTKEKSEFNSDFHSLKPLAEEYGIDCYCTRNVNDEETVNFIQSKSPEVIYCFGWSNLIGKKILDVPSYGVIGLHPTAIPMNRGRHPIIWALALGLTKTASSFFVMDENADTGDVVSQTDIMIDYDDDAQSLYNKVLDTAKMQVIELTKQIENGRLNRIPQNTKLGNTWRKRGRMDGQIDWRMSCDGIYNLVRALTHPYVGAHFVYKEKDYKVWKCKVHITDEYANIEPGKVVKINSNNSFIVKAYDGLVYVLNCDAISIKEGEYLL